VNSEQWKQSSAFCLLPSVFCLLSSDFTLATPPATPFPTRMKTARSHVLVLVTAPDLKTARTLAKASLKARLVACANLVPKIESHYSWRGTIEQGAEVLMMLKTTRRRLAALEKFILTKHPYDTPEFLVVPLESGTAKYLDWLTAAVD